MESTPTDAAPHDWVYEPAPDLGESLVDRLRRFPREPDMLVYGARALAAIAIRVGLRVWHRLEISGRENLPAEGAFVMVANHSSHLDTLALLSALPFSRLHNAFPAAAADTFFTSVPRIALATIAINALPFHRKTRQKRSLDLCRGLLGNPKNVLILFPEGTRSATGEIGEFKPGIGLLLAGSDIPVVPCRIEGAHAAWPRHACIPRPRKLRLRIGTPRSYADLPRGRESAEWIAEELRSAVLEA
ncbi:MAG: lysophospholipid acyltransferase family protein [Planctomycetota bacterium]